MRIAGRLDSWQGGCADLRSLKEFRLGGLKYIPGSQQARGLNSQVFLPAQTLTCKDLQFRSESQR